MDKNKRPILSKKQRRALIKGCQESPLTVEAYAKDKKVAPSSLYRWAELEGVSLKPGKKTRSKINQDQYALPETKSSRGSTRSKGGKIRKETQEMPGFEFTYTFKEFSKFIKGVIKKTFSKNESL